MDFEKNLSDGVDSAEFAELMMGSGLKDIERVLERFKMKDATPISTPLANHFILSKKSCSNEELMDTLYSSAVGRLMYVMVYTRPDIAHVVAGAVSLQSRLEKCVALLTTEAGYIIAAEAGNESYG
ncbi:hypothetical protein RJ640_020222 [Escallonia rubra]|uniref:Uncharacterized protein n=1 Tax=Escallonia rubra TaxID=112253 RepID=A0AA88UCG3_9ASTE|nr:hypothetical protein RJ640_020222 [Escallonia rubra]